MLWQIFRQFIIVGPMWLMLLGTRRLLLLLELPSLLITTAAPAPAPRAAAAAPADECSSSGHSSYSWFSASVYVTRTVGPIRLRMLADSPARAKTTRIPDGTTNIEPRTASHYIRAIPGGTLSSTSYTSCLPAMAHLQYHTSGCKWRNTGVIRLQI